MTVVLACRAVLAVVFAVSALGKVRPTSYATFERSVRDARLLPRGWSRPATAGLVAAEAAVVPLLAVPALAPWGAALAAALLLVFLAVIGLTVRRRQRLVCHCFGTASSSPLGARHAVRNTLLLLACAGAAWPTPASTAPAPPDVALALTTGGVVALVLVRLDDLVDALRPPLPR